MLKVMYDIGFKGNRPKKNKKEKNFDTPIKRKKPTNFGVLTPQNRCCTHETDLIVIVYMKSNKKNHCIK